MKTAVVDVDKQYELDKYQKNEYSSLMIKEFRKYGKKLAKIANFEQMLKEGKTLNQEMKDLLSKKDQFNSHLTSLKAALDMFEKSQIQLPGAVPQEKPKEMKNEMQENIKEICERNEKRLGYFLAIAASLNNKDLIPNPFNTSKIPTPEQQVALNKLYKEIIGITENQEISLNEESKRITLAIHSLLTESSEGIDSGEGRKPTYSELVSIVDQIAENKVITDLKYKVRIKEEEQKQPIMQKEIYAEIPPQPKVARQEERKEVVVSAPQPEPQKEEEPLKKGEWAEEVDEPEESQETKVVSQPATKAPVEESKPEEGGEGEEEEDSFTIVKDKKEERDERLKERKGRGRGRGQGRRRAEQEGERGQYRERRRGRRGENQGRGERRRQAPQ